MIRSLKRYHKKHPKKSILFIIFFAFIFGILFYKFKFFPYSYLSKIYHKLKTEPFNYKEISFFNELFTENIIDKNLLIYKEVNSPSELWYRIKEIEVPLSKFSHNLFDSIVILNDSIFTLNKFNVKVINYSLYGNLYKTYSFVNQIKSDTAWLIIPGSDPNQSTAIVLEYKDNYHYGLYSAIKNNLNCYVFIKPNEDILAWHNGKKKINGNAYYNTLINNGSSFGYSYLVQSVAIVKYLKSKSKFIIISGLSQGGMACLLNAVFSNPNVAIISSGYSVLNDTIYISGFDQMVIPNLRSIFSSYQLDSLISLRNTKYLFTYGSNDNSFYRDTSMLKNNKMIFKNNNNVNIHTFIGGHQYPVNVILNWLKNKCVE
ncbi:MAG: hypothetical protein ACK4K9_05535 [Bacteroidia bacterium]